MSGAERRAQERQAGTESLEEAVRGWLLSTRSKDPRALIEGLVEVVLPHLPLERLATTFYTDHPELLGVQAIWSREGGVRMRAVDRAIRQRADYLDSPVRVVLEEGRTLRFRLEGAGPHPHPILDHLAAEGVTDYLILPLTSGRWVRGYMSWSTAREGGFRDEEVAALEASTPLLALRTELASAHYTTHSLLEVYLGANAARRVTAGSFERGCGELIRCALWYSDMRGFTGLGDRLSAAELVALLNRYFERVADAIDAEGGEVLKLIGDAVLAVFPVGDGDDADASRRAFTAACTARKGLTELNAELTLEGTPRLEMGTALHLGEVMYGNVGGRRRLDFTVIGATVNEVARIEGLCKMMQEPLLLSEPFARALGLEGLRALGPVSLRGASGERSLFAPVPTDAQS